MHERITKPTRTEHHTIAAEWSSGDKAAADRFSTKPEIELIALDAKRVVVSLWDVNDKATADLMTKFYEKMLKRGETPAAGLRAAQVEMWKQKQWQSPYYWAAFTMQGEWR